MRCLISSQNPASLYTVTDHLWTSSWLALPSSYMVVLLEIQLPYYLLMMESPLYCPGLPYKYRNGLKTTKGSLRYPFKHPDWLLFCGGSYKWYFWGNIITGYAIDSPTWTVEAYSFPIKISPSYWTLSSYYSLHIARRENCHYLHRLQICFWRLPCCWHNLVILWILNLCWYSSC